MRRGDRRLAATAALHGRAVARTGGLLDRPVAPTASILLALTFCSGGARADDGAWRFAVGAQLTGVAQTNTISGGPVDQDTSFGWKRALGWSTTGTLMLAASPVRGAMLVVEPEWADGAGMPHVSGLSSYANGEIVRVSKVGTAPYVARAFLHLEFPLAGELVQPRAPDTPEEAFLPGGDHLFSRKARSTLEVTVGKVAMNDLFDASAVGSDTRHRFLSWALWEQGAWDYPADTRGYTWATVVALDRSFWAVRGGIALMPTEANGPTLDWDLRNSRAEMLEGELRLAIVGVPVTTRLLLFANHARMGSYRDALAARGADAPPSVDAVARQGAVKLGAGLVIDIELAPGLVGFARAGANDGRTESFAFTEIDRSLSFGAQLEGSRWGRPRDHLGGGVAVSGLSSAHADYLAAGGHGFQLGDGSLAYRPEWVGELYYVWSPADELELTADVQGFADPGMNAARQPLAVFGLRAHLHY